MGAEMWVGDCFLVQSANCLDRCGGGSTARRYPCLNAITTILFTGLCNIVIFTGIIVVYFPRSSISSSTSLVNFPSTINALPAGQRRRGTTKGLFIETDTILGLGSGGISPGQWASQTSRKHGIRFHHPVLALVRCVLTRSCHSGTNIFASRGIFSDWQLAI